MDLIAWHALTLLLAACAGAAIGLNIGSKARDKFLADMTAELAQMLTETKTTLELLHEHAGNGHDPDAGGGIDYRTAVSEQIGAPGNGSGPSLVTGRPPGAH